MDRGAYGANLPRSRREPTEIERRDQTSISSSESTPVGVVGFLTDGSYNPEDGCFYSESGRPKVYYASDTVQSDRYRGLRPADLIDISVFHGLHFHGPSERGVVFHLISALSEFGKLGIVAIGDNDAQADFLYRKTLEVLDEETSPIGVERAGDG